MDKYIFDKSNGLWYELVSDYYFPCLTVPAEEEQSVGVWGQQHKRYLKEHHPALYNALLLSGKLNGYLADIDQQAQEQFGNKGTACYNGDTRFYIHFTIPLF